MELSDEEIERIASGVAAKVVDGRTRCGLAAWQVQRCLALCRAIINIKHKAMLETYLPVIKLELNKLEEFCGVDLEDLREKLSTIWVEALGDNWDKACYTQDAIYWEISRRLVQAHKQKEKSGSS